MKTSIIKKTAVITGLLLGSFALAAIAANPWTAPTATPPNGNVAAPINVGGGETGNIYSQKKTGFLSLANFIFNPTLTPDTVNEGYVLTAADNDGTVKWAPGGSGTGTGGVAGTCNTGQYMTGISTTGTIICNDIVQVMTNKKVFSNSDTFIVPSGVTKIKTEVWGGGGAGQYMGGAGGGGGYASGYLTVTPGSSLPVVVGIGGQVKGITSGGGGLSYIVNPTVLFADGGKYGDVYTYRGIAYVKGGQGGLGGGTAATYTQTGQTGSGIVSDGGQFNNEGKAFFRCDGNGDKVAVSRGKGGNGGGPLGVSGSSGTWTGGTGGLCASPWEEGIHLSVESGAIPGGGMGGNFNTHYDYYGGEGGDGLVIVSW